MNVYAFSDLHGRYDLWQQIKEHVNPEDQLFCLGDNIDRGPDGIKIFNELEARPHTICLKGNHEDIAAAALKDLVQGFEYTRPIQLWFGSGGEVTWESIKDWPTLHIFGLIDHFEQLPETIQLERKTSDKIIILDHAGFTIGQENGAEPLWDRQHFYHEWPKEDEIFNPEKTFIVHGHTPVQYLDLWLYNSNHIKERFARFWKPDSQGNLMPEIIRYANGHKFDIDLGSVASNRAALLNLDTFEVTYIGSH